MTIKVWNIEEPFCICNISVNNFITEIKIYKNSAENLPFARENYNLAFLDAPYNKNLSESAIGQLLQKEWLEKGSLIVIETQKEESFVAPFELFLEDERIYGPAKFRFFKLEQFFIDKNTCNLKILC